MAPPSPIPGEPVTNELRPQPQSVKVEEAPPAPAARGVQHDEPRAPRQAGETPQGDAARPLPGRAAAAAGLAARERRLAQRQASLDARERQLRRRESEAAAGAGDSSTGAAAAPESTAAEMGTGAPKSAGTAPGDAGPAAASPAEPPSPQPEVPVTVPAGAAFEVELTQELASNTSSVGQTFRSRLVSDVRLDGMIAIPAGSEVLGVVTEAVGARRIGGHARLTVKFTDLVLPSGSTVPLRASFLEEGKSRAGRDAATIGGSTAGGALLGRILSSSGRGTVLGALVGAAVGTAIAAKAAGEEVVIPEGSVVKLKLDAPLDVRAQR